MLPWSRLRYFTKDENWGEPDLMDPVLLYELDAYRHFIGVPLVVSCGTQGKHTRDSLHYMGMAVDLIAPDQAKSLFDLYLAAERFKFVNIGLYNYWHYQGRRCGGLHLDMGHEAGQELGHRWLGIETDKGQEYIAFTMENLIKGGFL